MGIKIPHENVSETDAHCTFRDNCSCLQKGLNTNVWNEIWWILNYLITSTEVHNISDKSYLKTRETENRRLKPSGACVTTRKTSVAQRGEGILWRLKRQAYNDPGECHCQLGPNCFTDCSKTVKVRQRRSLGPRINFKLTSVSVTKFSPISNWQSKS